MRDYTPIARQHWHHGPTVSTIRGYDDCNDYFYRTSKGFQLRVSHSASELAFIHRCITFGSIQIDLSDIHCDGDFRVDAIDELDCYYLKQIVSGSCALSIDNQEFVAERGQAFAVNPFGTFSVRLRGHCEILKIRIDRGALEQALGEELNTNITLPLCFSPAPISSKKLQPVGAIIDLIYRDAEEADVFGNWRLGRHFERLVHLAILHCLPNNYSEMLHQAAERVPPYYVRKIEEYIRTHISRDILVEDLAEVANMSKRSLFYNFRRWRNTTPRGYLKNVRLDVAREALSTGGDRSRSVTDVATSVGYWNLGRFASEYRARFGELPSETLRRG
ncbi:MAG TPA: helix-turn-helix transcriptional regulator [Allosphingosinicella sp.]|nr:helix-turn-helix transcriptional regulator [Allosphingosinicella sp.]